MNLPLGLIAKSLVGLVSVGGIGTGTGVFFAKSSWTQLDKDVFGGNGTWTWTSTPTDSGSITAETKELKIEVSATTTTPSKTGKCTIKGKIPEGVTSGTSKVSEQLTALKTAIGTETSGSGKPDNTGDKGDKAKKFFSSCIKNRTLSEWSEARKGNKGESTIHMEIKKVDNTSTDYKFNEKEFKKLYGGETAAAAAS